MISTLLKKVFGSRNDRLLKQYRAVVARINALEPDLQQLDDAASLRAGAEEGGFLRPGLSRRHGDDAGAWHAAGHAGFGVEVDDAAEVLRDMARAVEGALALAPLDQALFLQLLQRGADRGAARAVMAAELVLGGHRARMTAAGAEAAFDAVGDVLIFDQGHLVGTRR